MNTGYTYGGQGGCQDRKTNGGRGGKTYTFGGQ
jgi:hypothetical protein